MWQESNTWPVVVVQSQRSSAAVPPRPAQRHHLRPSPEGWHHHQALAGPAGEEPTRGAGHWSQGHPSPPTVTPPPVAPRPPWGTPAKNCLTAKPSIMDTQSWRCFYERLSERKGSRLLIFLWTHVQANSLSLCDSVLMDPRFQRHWLFLPRHVFCNQFTDRQ